LYTPKAVAATKLDAVKKMGRDADGAWRAHGRLDKKDR
jgi:hypothetical protein